MPSPATGRPVALLTGASRGIGRASALLLADAGYDLVLTGRSVATPVSHGRHELAGHLLEVRAEAERRGVTATVAALDLLDPSSIDAAVASGIEAFGRIDAVVHAATHIASGMQSAILELPPASLEESLRANVVGSMQLFQRVLPGMLERGSGVWISIVSGAAVLDPPHPADQGGWGFLYGAQKAGLYRMTGIAHREYGARGLRAYNLQPGIVATEVLRKSLGVDGPLEDAWGAAPPEVPASVIRWLITNDTDGQHLGRAVHAQKLCAQLDLVPGWTWHPPESA